jgi:spermidine/putrescine transport system ATP-binding protein
MTNAVPVRVIGEEFVGATATLYLETAQGKEIRVQKGHDEIAGLPTDIGQQLYAWWNPQDGHVIAEA